MEGIVLLAICLEALPEAHVFEQCTWSLSWKMVGLHRNNILDPRTTVEQLLKKICHPMTSHTDVPLIFYRILKKKKIMPVYMQSYPVSVLCRLTQDYLSWLDVKNTKHFSVSSDNKKRGWCEIFSVLMKQ